MRNIAPSGKSIPRAILADLGRQAFEPAGPAGVLGRAKFVRGCGAIRGRDVNFYCSKSSWAHIYFLLSVRLLLASSMR